MEAWLRVNTSDFDIEAIERGIAKCSSDMESYRQKFHTTVYHKDMPKLQEFFEQSKIRTISIDYREHSIGQYEATSAIPGAAAAKLMLLFSFKDTYCIMDYETVRLARLAEKIGKQ